MATVYLLTPAETSGYDIDAAHEISLPGVICPNCGTWAQTGVAYPTVRREVLGPFLSRLSKRPLPLSEFRELRRDLSELVAATRPLFPGTQFGAAVGEMSGQAPDFAWGNPWTLFAQRQVFETMCERGVFLTGASAQLKTDGADARDLVELEAIPRVHVHESVVAAQGLKECGLCGRLGIRKPDVIVLDAASLDPSIPLQRVFGLTAHVVNCEFAEVVRKEDLCGVKLVPVECL